MIKESSLAIDASQNLLIRLMGFAHSFVFFFWFFFSLFHLVFLFNIMVVILCGIDF